MESENGLCEPRYSTSALESSIMKIVQITQNLVWRGQFATTVTIGCEPGQVRKEAAVAADAGTAFQRVETASLLFFTPFTYSTYLYS